MGIPSLSTSRIFEMLQNARVADLSRPGKDPGPILLTYKPLLDVVKKMAANAQAVQKKNGKESKFVLKPVIQHVKVMEKQANGTMKEVDTGIREYDHPSTGTWWNKMQEQVGRNKLRDLAAIMLSCLLRFWSASWDQCWRRAFDTCSLELVVVLLHQLSLNALFVKLSLSFSTF